MLSVHHMSHFKTIQWIKDNYNQSSLLLVHI